MSILPLEFYFQLFSKPDKFWEEKSESPPKLMTLLFAYVLPFVFLGAISKAIWQIYNSGFSDFVFFELLLNTIIGIFGIVFTVLLINELAPRYKAKNDVNVTAMVFIYGLTPLFVMSIFFYFLLQPFIIMLLGLLYSAYPISKGFNKIMDVPLNMLTGFTIISIMLFLGVNYFFNAIFNAVLSMF